MRKQQQGYMYEVPLILMATVVAAAVVLPLLPVILRKILAIAGSLVLIAGLYYMIVVPGWQGSTRHLGRPWSLIVFALCAALALLVAGSYVLKD